MSARNMARFNVTENKLEWLVKEPHRCTAAEVAILNDRYFVQAGTDHNIRRLIDGQIEQSIATEQEFGRRHGRLFRASNSEQYFSWAYDFSVSYDSNASDGVMCWDRATLTPNWLLLDLGEEETVTLSPAGQIISATQQATDHLVWIVREADGIKLQTWDQFQSKL